jgi:hypothetical protein
MQLVKAKTLNTQLLEALLNLKMIPDIQDEEKEEI